MYLEKNEIEPFRGDGSVNEAGESLEVFLEKYNAKNYDCPCNTVDMLIFREGRPKKLLMVKRRNHPSIGAWAAPGGFVDIDEDLYDAAKRELMEETGVTGVPMIQLRTWGDPKRDPRWRVITTAYLALLGEEIPVKAGDDAADALWFDVELIDPSGKMEGELKLNLLNEERGIRLGARVLIEYRSAGTLLSEPSYQLLENRGIANDHALLITDALVRMENAGV